MRVRAPVLCLLLCAGRVLAQEADEPGIVTAPPSDADEPGIVSTPLSDLDEPGVAATPAPAPAQATTAVRRAPPPASSSLEGLTLRFSYKTFTLPETTRDGPTSTRFHMAVFDVYPISWWLRLGLSTQAGMESDSPNHDWLVTQGMVLGLQRPGHNVVPFVDLGVHVGVGTRTFYVSQINREADQLTLLWDYAAEAGIDWRVAGGTKTTIAVGVQRTSFFSNGTPQDPIATTTDTTFTFKIGIGY